MDVIDLSGEWAILAPLPAPPAVEDLARCIAALRKQAGLDGARPAVLDAAGPAPGDETPIIVLNMESSGPGPGAGSYTWRLGRGRVEIYGDSLRGLGKGIYSFLGALGFRWPAPAQELPPPVPGASAGQGLAGQSPAGPAGSAVYPLTVPGIYVRADPSPENRSRLLVPPRTADREIPGLCRWAARNRVDALVFSLRDKRFRRPRKGPGSAAEQAVKNWGLIVERGGWDLSFLVPRRYFFFRRDLFRMEGGLRKRDHHFCPTNPETIRILRRRAAALLDQPESTGPEAGGPETGRIYHLWPDRGAEGLWCACPACRAFNPREQIRLAINTVAALVAEKDPLARISCREAEENSPEQLPGGSEISLRPNVFALKTANPPDKPGQKEETLLYICEQGAVCTKIF